MWRYILLVTIGLTIATFAVACSAIWSSQPVHEKDGAGAIAAAAVSLGIAAISFICWFPVVAAAAFIFIGSSKGIRHATDWSAAKMAETAKGQKERQTVSDQMRRGRARAGCDALYAKHAVEISERFSKEMYDSFAAKHLGDDKPPEYVEEQAKALVEIIKIHLKKPELSTDDGADERQAARAAVHEVYDEHASLLAESFPPKRFAVEMKVRIPDSASPEAAWKAARKMIHELLVIVAEEKQERGGKEKPRLQINPPLENL